MDGPRCTCTASSLWTVDWVRNSIAYVIHPSLSCRAGSRIRNHSYIASSQVNTSPSRLTLLFSITDGGEISPRKGTEVLQWLLV